MVLGWYLVDIDQWDFGFGGFVLYEFGGVVVDWVKDDCIDFGCQEFFELSYLLVGIVFCMYDIQLYIWLFGGVFNDCICEVVVEW